MIRIIAAHINRQSILHACVALALLLLTQAINAHPVIWKGGKALMHSSNLATTSTRFMFSQNYDWALGLQQLNVKNTNNTYTFAESNSLLKRWNGLGSQGNIYLLSGLGLPNQDSNSDMALHLGVQTDWETRRVYTYFRTDYYALETAMLNLRGRVGVAPYIGNFEAVHTWLILQADDIIMEDTHTLAITPVIRWFKDNILIEVGSNFGNSTFIAAMLHF
jgi:hypothetical protein